MKTGVVRVKELPDVFRNSPPPNPFDACAEHDVKFRFVEVRFPPLTLTNSPPPLPFAPDDEHNWHVTFVIVVVVPVVRTKAATDPLPVVRVMVT